MYLTQCAAHLHPELALEGGGVVSQANYPGIVALAKDFHAWKTRPLAAGIKVEWSKRGICGDIPGHEKSFKNKRMFLNRSTAQVSFYELLL